MPVVGVEPTRVISTRDFEFLSSSSKMCIRDSLKTAEHQNGRREEEGDDLSKDVERRAHGGVEPVHQHGNVHVDVYKRQA